MLHPTHETEYREAIDAIGRPYNTVTGTIYFSDGTELEISDEILSEDPVSISRQCVDGDRVMFGGVFTDVLKLNLITDVDRYKFFGAKIVLTYEIEIAITEGTSVSYEMESVPLGIFYVADAERPSDEINLTAYDSMTLLDKELGTLQISGNAWAVLNQVSQDCDYPLAFTEQDLANFPNYDHSVTCSSDNGIKTYRDVVKTVCQMLGCFALDDREGNLKLKAFSITPDITLGDNETYDYPWYTYVPADYECAYIGISVTSTEGTFTKITETASAVGTILVMEDAPAWDYGLQATSEEKLANLYDLLYDDVNEQPILSYTPGSVDMPADATFECGDMVAFNTQYSDEPYHFIITSIEWKFHNGMDLESVGINPYIEGSTPETEESNRILNHAVASNKLQFINITNNTEIEITSSETEKIATVIFTPTTVTSALFVATILVNISNVADISEQTETETITVPVVPYYNDTETTVTDINGNPVTFSGTTTKSYTYKRSGKCEASLYYVLDGVKVPNDEDPYIAVDSLENGKHIITVSYLFRISQPKRYVLDIYMNANGGTITIGPSGLQAALMGQEIDEVDKWDGNLIINDESPLNLLNLGNIAVANLYQDEFVVNVDPESDYEWLPNQIYIQEAIQIPDPEGPDYPIVEHLANLFSVDSITVHTLYEADGELIPHIFFYSYLISTENDDILVTEDNAYSLETEGMVSSSPEEE